MSDQNAQVSLNGAYKIKNFVTGETSAAYEIVQLDSGAIRITDVYSADGTENTVERAGIEEIFFGDGTRLLTAVQSNSWGYTWNQFDNETQSETAVEVRHGHIQGGVFDDVIQGGAKHENIEGGVGNDTLLGSAGAIESAAYIELAGGNSQDRPLLRGEGTDTGLTATLDNFSNGQYLVDGVAEARWISSGSVSGNILALASDAAGNAVDLGGQDWGDTYETLLAAVAQLQASGHTVQLQMQGTFSEDVGNLLVGVFDPDVVGASDDLRGGEGNDFIDGGISGAVDWRGNEARYSGASSDYSITQVTLSDGGAVNTTQMLNGSSIADFANLHGVTAANLAELMTALGLNQQYLVDGETYTFVVDSISDRDGIDMVTNIQSLSFTDRAINLEVEVREMEWRDLPGKDYQGSIVADEIIASDGGYDQIHGQGGNDFILSGDGGDHVSGGRGNDYADGGANGTSQQYDWQNKDVYQVDGPASRFTVSKATQVQVEEFWAGFTLSTQPTYEAEANYWLIEDSNAELGLGRDLITGFEEISFSDNWMRLDIESNLWDEEWNDSAELSVRGTEFSDSVFADAELEQHQLGQGRLVRVWAELGDGDDQYFGLTDQGDRVDLGGGNDLFVGNGSGAGDEWYARDEVQYQGKAQRYQIQQLEAGQTIVVDEVSIDATELSAGVLVFDGQTFDVGVADSLIVVRDYLPSDFGGSGVDVLIGAKRIQFNDSDVQVEARIDANMTHWREDPVLRAYIEGPVFGLKADFSEGVLAFDEDGNQQLVTEGHIRASDADDEIFGFDGENYVELGGGDDIFVALSDQGESGENRWDYFDRVRYDYDSSNYIFGQTYLELIDGEFTRDSDGVLSEYLEAGENRLLFTKVTDIRPNGDGVDYLYGVEEVEFQDRSIDFAIDEQIRDRNLDLQGPLNELNLDSGQVRFTIDGTEFSDFIDGRDSPNYTSEALTEAGYSLMQFSAEESALIIQGVPDGESLVLFSLDSNGRPVASDTVKDDDTFQIKMWLGGEQSLAAGLRAAIDQAVADSGLNYQTLMQAIGGFLEQTDLQAPDGSNYVQDLIAFGEVVRDDGTFIAPAHLNLLGELTTRVDLGLNQIQGNGGDDILVGGDGPSSLSGGVGNDLLVGGGQLLDGAAGTTYGPWQMIDQAQYSGSADQYQVTKIYVQLNEENRLVAEAATQLDETYQVAYVVQDSVPDSLGGEGRDILVGIEELRFEASDENLRLADLPRWDYASWMPLINNSDLPDDLGDGIPQLSIWDRASAGSEIDVGALWEATAPAPIEFSSKFGNHTVSLSGFTQIQASAGNDVIRGREAELGYMDIYTIRNASLDDFSISQEVDQNGHQYVQLTRTAEGLGLQSAKLYNVDRIDDGSTYLYTDQAPLARTLPYEMDAYVFGTLFDDVINASEYLNVSDQTDHFLSVWGNWGDDRVNGGADHLNIFDWAGNDHFEGGSGIDFVQMDGQSLRDLSVNYFFDLNNNDLLDPGEEISLEEFQSSGIQAYYQIEAGQSGVDSGTSTEIDLATYLTSHQANNLVVSSRELAAETSYADRGAGWVDFNENYFVQVEDRRSIANDEIGNGRNVLSNVEAIILRGENAIYDITSGQLHYLNGFVTPRAGVSVETVTSVALTEAIEDLDPLQGLGVAEVRTAIDLLTGDSGIDLGGQENDGSKLVGELEIQASHGHSVTTGFAAYLDLSNQEVKQALIDLATGIIPAEQISMLSNLAELYVTDQFIDGVGNDIYLGNGVGEGLTSAGWVLQDKVSFSGAKANFALEYGRLDGSGAIVGLDSTSSQNLIDFRGTAFDSYLRVRDLRSEENGGQGDNYLFGISRVSFDSATSGTDVGLRSDLSDDGRVKFRQYDAKAHFNVNEHPSLLQKLADDEVQGVEIRYQLVTLDQMDEGVVGIIGNFNSSAEINPSYAESGGIRFETSVEGFEFSSAFASIDDEGRFVLDEDGNVALFSSEDSPQNGTIQKITLIDLPAGGQIAVHGLLSARFSDVDVNLESRYRSEVENWSPQFTDENGAIISPDVFTVGRIDLGDVSGLLDMSQSELDAFVQASEESQSDTDMMVLQVNDGAGDDIIKLHSTNYEQSISLSTGDDFVHYTRSQDVEPFEARWNYQVRIEGANSDRFDMQTAYILLDAEGAPVLRSNGRVKFVTAETQDAVQAVVLSDKLPSSSEGYMGQKIVVGARQLRFEDTQILLGGEYREEDWDGDGITDMVVQRGSNLSELLSYREENGDVSDRLEGFGGDDVLVGGSGGDEFEGGAGNDLLVGGANGSTGDSWRDQDRANMWHLNASELDVETVVLGYNPETHELIRDGLGQVITDANVDDLIAGYQLTQAVQVTDKTGAEGTDWLIGVEVIGTRTGDIQTGVNVRIDDWDGDGVTDRIEFEGTEFADLIGPSTVLAEYLAEDNSFRLASGDDTLFAGAGGDYITVGSGIDFVDGGADGRVNEWGWVPRDEVRFEGELERYSVRSETFSGQAIEFADRENQIHFAIDSIGQVVRADNPDNVLVQLEEGQSVVVVEDLLPNFDFLDSDGFNLLVNVENLGFQDDWISIQVERNVSYDENGEALHGWMSGTMTSEDILGSSAGDWISGNAGDDVLIGLQGDDTLSGGAGDDILYGDLRDSRAVLEGNDRAEYRAARDQFVITKKVGEVEGETLSYIEVVDLIADEDGGMGTDILVGIEAISFSDDYIRVGVDVWRDYDENGALQSAHFNGSDFADDIHGSFVGDWIRDGAGNDVVYGHQGADQFELGAGDDVVYGGAEGKTPWGNEGVDTARFDGDSDRFEITYFDVDGNSAISYESDGYVVVTDSTAASAGGYGTDTLYGVEQLQFNDRTVTLGSYNSGNRVVGDNQNNVLNQDPWQTGADFRVEGNDGDDTLYGHSGNDVLIGGSGNDELRGGSGNDTAVMDGNFEDYTVTDQGDHFTVSDGTETDSLYDMEQVRFDDTRINLVESVLVRDFDRDTTFETAIFIADFDGSTLTDASFRGQAVLSDIQDRLASDLNYLIDGGVGDDTFTTGAGDDVVTFSVGSDVVDLGAGFDGVSVAHAYSDSWTVTATSISNGSDTTTLSNVEYIEFTDGIYSLVSESKLYDQDQDGTDDHGEFYAAFVGATFDAASQNGSISWSLIGGVGDDTLTGGDLSDELFAGDGNNVLDGGAGRDVAVVDGNKEDYSISVSDGVWTVSTDQDSTTLSNIESIRFKDGVERLVVETVENVGYIFGVGTITETSVFGTGYADQISVTGQIDGNNSDFTVIGGLEDADDGGDRFVIDLDQLATTRILDFQGLDSDTEQAIDTLVFSNAGEGVTAANLLEGATFDDDAGTVTFSINGGDLILEGVSLEDLDASVNVSLDLV